MVCHTTINKPSLVFPCLGLSLNDVYNYMYPPNASFEAKQWIWKALESLEIEAEYKINKFNS